MISLELKSIENYCLHQKKIIKNLKDIIQNKDNEIAKLYSENRQLKEQINERKGD